MVIHQVDRKWTAAPVNKFFGNMRVGFCLNRKTLPRRHFTVKKTKGP